MTERVSQILDRLETARNYRSWKELPADLSRALSSVLREIIAHHRKAVVRLLRDHETEPPALVRQSKQA